jgi:hypothetical protein
MNKHKNITNKNTLTPSNFILKKAFFTLISPFALTFFLSL